MSKCMLIAILSLPAACFANTSEDLEDWSKNYLVYNLYIEDYVATVLSEQEPLQSILNKKESQVSWFKFNIAIDSLSSLGLDHKAFSQYEEYSDKMGISIFNVNIPINKQITEFKNGNLEMKQKILLNIQTQYGTPPIQYTEIKENQTLCKQITPYITQDYYQQIKNHEQIDWNKKTLESTFKKISLNQLPCLVFHHAKYLSHHFELYKKTEQDNLLSSIIYQQKPDTVTANIYFVDLIRNNHYSEALRELSEYSKGISFYGDTYKAVQRIYSYKQKGSGKVAIKGI